eukprot:TRINITY_DN24045_c0_g1_i4.p1 TRINITY_DN24045_c0_g1~~TRINITY_DN24045_c0_g1_i4.p1  ORF type:complete len:243 (+),score=-14.96 TRINITY_DN24045_c0_g1_i4:534-1262(+)
MATNLHQKLLQLANKFKTKFYYYSRVRIVSTHTFLTFTQNKLFNLKFQYQIKKFIRFSLYNQDFFHTLCWSIQLKVYDKCYQLHVCKKIQDEILCTLILLFLFKKTKSENSATFILFQVQICKKIKPRKFRAYIKLSYFNSQLSDYIQQQSKSAELSSDATLLVYAFAAVVKVSTCQIFVKMLYYKFEFTIQLTLWKFLLSLLFLPGFQVAQFCIYNSEFFIAISFDISHYVEKIIEIFFLL